METIKITKDDPGILSRMFACEEHSDIDFHFNYGDFEIYLDFSNCEDDIYRYQQNKKITADPFYSVPDDYEEYLTTYEHVVVLYSKSGQEVDKETFAKEFDVSVAVLDKIVHILTSRAEPMYFGNC